MTRHAVLATLALVAGIVLALGIERYAEAQGAADAVAQLDAGPVADAAPTPPAVDAPDPVEDPGGFAKKVHQLWKGGALVPAVLVIAFGLVLLLRRVRPNWFTSGKQAVYFAAGLTFLTALAESASRGTTPSLAVTLAALGSALALAFKTEPKV